MSSSSINNNIPVFEIDPDVALLQNPRKDLIKKP